VNLTAATGTTVDPGPDPRRWITLAIVITSIFIVVLDNSVLNVAIPTILRDFHTTLPSLEWVVTGYALTFASLLIIGGRLGDVYGHRRVFIIGAFLFGTGSLLAAVSQSVAVLILGEAIIEGVGASMMMPATLAILSNTFTGRERATAFAAWGATAGTAAGFGPVVGGFLTTNFSWRWSFGINVVIAPLAIVGAILFMRRSGRGGPRVRIDLPGAILAASGMFLLVFGLTEGGVYGWFTPVKEFSIAGRQIWTKTAPVSITPLVFVLSLAILAGFYRFERAKERAGLSPLFEFGQLRHKGFRYGLLTTAILAMGQLGLIFVLPIFLQDAKHLTAEQNGLWMLPLGLFIILGAQAGGRLTRGVGVTSVVRLGLTFETVGLVLVAFAIKPHITFLDLLPGFVLFGLGVGFASSQLTNVVLSDIDKDKSGVASGANTTVRQLGIGLGAAIIGSLLTAQTIRHASRTVSAAQGLPATVRVQAIHQLHVLGANYSPPPNLAPADTATLRHALANAISDGTRPALFFAAAFVFGGALLSLLIPRIGPPGTGDAGPVLAAVETFENFEPVDPDPTIIGTLRGQPAKDSY
jgi:EmrB/QacA subfamily drug resistance transporter